MQSVPSSRVRYSVSAWLAAAAMIAYVCRNSIAVAEKTIRTDLGLSEAQMGAILGIAFFIPYAFAQIPTGWLGQYFGSRKSIPLLSFVWSVATGCFGLASGFIGLFIGRFSIGLAQAGLFPCSTSTISHWHPQTTRAFACGMLSAFMSVGGAIGVALTGFLLDYLHWRMIFALYSIPGIFWAAGFLFWFRDRPNEHPAVNEGELKLINAASTSSSSRDESDRTAISANLWIDLVCSPAMWMIASQQFFRAAGYIFFASWFATYLQETRGVSTSQSGFLSVGPLIATVCAALIGGAFSDWVFRRTGSLALARKGLAVMCLSASALLVFSAYFVENASLAVTIISAGAFCAGFAGPCAYTVTMDMGGRHVAPVFATMNMVGNFGAALLPWIVPHFRAAVERTPAALSLVGGNSWDAVLVLFAAMYILAALCWLMLSTKGTVFEQSLIK